jgi:hypothetical protein
MSKKIALCLYGRYNNHYNPKTSGDDGCKYIYKTIIKNFKNIDIFIHSWDISKEKHIINNYKKFVKDSKFEQQIDFSNIIKQNNIYELAYNNPKRDRFRTIGNWLSFFYSRKATIELKKLYEEKNNFIYDCCLVCRFDLGQVDKYNGYQPYKVSEINFNPNLDMKYIYSAMWNQLNCGYADQWFYSSSKNINFLTQMYQKSFEYFRHNSEYIKKLCNKWPDSNHNDPFSNEFLKSKEFKSTILSSRKIQDALDIHAMHKQFFIDIGLYNKSRFL